MSEAKSKFSLNTKNMLIILLAAMVIVISFLIPENQIMSQLEMRTVGLMISFLIIFLTDALPTVIASLFYSALIPLLGITKVLPNAFSGFTQPIVFFIIISFAVAMAITRVPIAKRILRLLLVKFGKNVDMVLLAVMISTFLISTFVSDIPTTILFLSISLSFLELIDNEEKKRSVGKAFTIGVPLSAIFGGIATPSGSALTLIGIAQLEKLTGSGIPYLEWMFIAAPYAILAELLGWWLIVKIYKPTPISKDEIKSMVDSIHVPKKFTNNEIKVIIIISLMFVFWVASTWISEINIILVTLVGGSLFFFPGINVVDVESYLKEVSWKVVFVVATMFSISNLLMENGLPATISKVIPTLDFNIILVVAFLFLLSYILLVIMPNSLALLPILALAIASMAEKTGISAKFLIVAIILALTQTYFFPFDAMFAISYGKGYFSAKELPKSALILMAFSLVFLSLWMPFACKLLGWL